MRSGASRPLHTSGQQDKCCRLLTEAAADTATPVQQLVAVAQQDTTAADDWSAAQFLSERVAGAVADALLQPLHAACAPHGPSGGAAATGSA